MSFNFCPSMLRLVQAYKSGPGRADELTAVLSHWATCDHCRAAGHVGGLPALARLNLHVCPPTYDYLKELIVTAGRPSLDTILAYRQHLPTCPVCGHRRGVCSAAFLMLERLPFYQPQDLEAALIRLEMHQATCPQCQRAVASVPAPVVRQPQHWADAVYSFQAQVQVQGG